MCLVVCALRVLSFLECCRGRKVKSEEGGCWPLQNAMSKVAGRSPMITLVVARLPRGAGIPHRAIAAHPSVRCR